MKSSKYGILLLFVYICLIPVYYRLLEKINIEKIEKYGKI